MASVLGAGLVALALACVHLLAGSVVSRRSIPRSPFLSMASGVSVAYVFVHLLPAVAARQLAVVEAAGSPSLVAAVGRERVLFVAALLGFCTFYGLEQLVHGSYSSDSGETGDREHGHPAAGVFWIHVASFAVYNALIGYFLLHRADGGAAALLLYGTAMGLHFVVNDDGLRDHHQAVYEERGRWVLAAAVLAGFGLGVFVGIPEHLLSLLLAYLAGGIVLNVIKEELPAERESRFWAFGVGAAGYGVLLLLL